MIKKPADLLSFSLLILFAVLPLVLGLGYALLYSFGITGALSNGFTFFHWQKIFSDNEIWMSFLYSGWLAAASLLLSVGAALFIAIHFHRYFSKGIFSYLVYMPLAFPAIVGAFFFSQFLANAGFLSRIFYQLGITNSIEDFPSLVNDQYSVGIILTSFFLSLPFFILLYTGLYKTEKMDEYLQLSASLGATGRQSVLSVAVPVLLKKSVPNIVMYFIFKLGAYEVPLLLGRSSPETVSVLAVRKLQKFNLLDIPTGYGIAVLYTIIILALLLFVLRTDQKSYET